MPCDSSYMKPSKLEQNSVDVARHIVRVYELLNLRVVPDDVRMAAENTYGLIDYLDRHTALLCELMREHELTVFANLKNNDVADANLWMWWCIHQQADRVREAREQADEDRIRRDEMAELARLYKKYGPPDEQ